ncbi:MAG: type III-A CRISPR-associated RAMP protein Csm3 [Acholeplasmataceae bacterium]|jgi:CRISPR-associated protein Csm3|nr:type III-A CRISPR-associated RAMP protein Csm3 [Acholeplasmataceae bacterium]
MKKIIIKGDLIVKTGLHIGGDDSFSAIGAIDSPVIRNTATGLPIIPGSSLKGKIRSLLAKNEQGEKVDFSEEKPELKRLFGSDDCRARLIFSDCNIDFKHHKEKENLTEGKWENKIDRKTGGAKPRQIERVVPETNFEFQLVYNVIEEKDVKADFQMLSQGFKLLMTDYLGGGGTRGSGRVMFLNLKTSPNEKYNTKELDQMLEEVCSFGKKLYS